MATHPSFPRPRVLLFVALVVGLGALVTGTRFLNDRIGVTSELEKPLPSDTTRASSLAKSASTELTNPKLQQIRADVASADADYVPSKQVLIQGMRLAEQPAGYGVRALQNSVSNALTAFVTTQGERAWIVVVDKRDGKQSRLPPPNANVLEQRSIEAVQWGTEDGSDVLYVIEDATDGPRTRDQIAAMRASVDLHNEAAVIKLMRTFLDSRYWVLSAWKLDDKEPRVLSKITGRPLAMAWSANRGLQIVTESKSKGWGYVELCRYDGEQISSKAVRISRGGQPIDHDPLQLLPLNQELWFVTRLATPTRPTQEVPLAVGMLDLKAADPEAEIVVPGADSFAWSGDERVLVIRKPHIGTYTLYKIMRNDASRTPQLLLKDVLSSGSSFPFQGMSKDGRILYLQGFADSAPSPDLAAMADAMRLYEYPLP